MKPTARTRPAAVAAAGPLSGAQARDIGFAIPSNLARDVVGQLAGSAASSSS